MRKFIISFILLATLLSVQAQDIVYTVQGTINDKNVPLDSILVDNYSSGKRLVFKKLPTGSAYKINLSKGTIDATTNVELVKPIRTYYEQLSLASQSYGRITVNYNGTIATNSRVRVYSLQGVALYAQNLQLQPKSHLQIDIPYYGICLVSVQVGGEIKSFKVLGNSNISNVYKAENILGVKGDVKEFSSVINERKPVKAPSKVVSNYDFIEGDEIQFFLFKSNYYCNVPSMTLEKSQKLRIPLLAKEELFIEGNVTIDVPIENNESIDLTGYKIVGPNIDVPVVASSMNRVTKNGARYAVAKSSTKIDLYKGTNIKLLSVQNKHGVPVISVMTRVIPDDEWINNPNIIANAETTALAELINNPLFGVNSADMLDMLKKQLKSLPSFETYKKSVGRAIYAAMKNQPTTDIDFTKLVGYQDVLREYIKKYLIENKIEGFVKVEFEEWHGESDAHYKVINKGKRTVHIYANRQYVNSKGVFKKPAELSNQKEDGGIELPLVRLKSDKLDYWSTVSGTIWDGWIKGEDIPEYIFKSETGDIAVTLEGANKLEIEVWGLGKFKSNESFEALSDKDKFKFILVVIDAFYNDIIMPVIDLALETEKKAPPVGNGKWDFRYGSKQQPFYLLIQNFTTDFMKDKNQVKKLIDNIREQKYFAIANNLGAFFIDKLVNDRPIPLNNKNGNVKYLNLVYNSLKNTTGISRTTETFRANIKKTANHALNKLNLAAQTVAILESSGDLVGSGYYAFKSDVKSTFTNSYKGIQLDPRKLEIMPNDTAVVNISGDEIDNTAILKSDDSAIATATFNADRTKIKVKAGSRKGITTINLIDNKSNFKEKIEVNVNNECIPPIELEKYNVKAPVGEKVIVKILKGSKEYKVYNPYSRLAAVTIKGNEIEIVGREPNYMRVQIIDRITQKSKILQINVTPKSTTGDDVYGDTYTVNGVSFTMVPIPSGTFMMGSPATESGRNSDEQQHKVSLSAFTMGQTEVTQALWKAVMGNNPSHFKGDDLPVQNVSWNDIAGIVGFLKKLNALTGKKFRLPTEAEWEYACRAGSIGPFYTGKSLGYDQACISEHGPVKVKSYPPNAWELYDMHGNVSEWCIDWYGAYPTTPQYDPICTTINEDNALIVRGSCYGGYSSRSAARHSEPMYTRLKYIGFRLVCTP